MSNTFLVQAYTQAGQLLSEKTLCTDRDDVATLHSAERFARRHLFKNRVESVIVVVSQETLTKLRQVQFRVSSTMR